MKKIDNNLFLQLLALANMLFGGHKFCVVQKPDWNGGHYFALESLDYENKDFEYTAWCGSSLEFATQNPSFEAHREPFHEEPVDYPVTALELLQGAL